MCSFQELIGRDCSTVGDGNTVNVAYEIIEDCTGTLNSRFRTSVAVSYSNKACLTERAILRLLDHDAIWSWRRLSTPGEGGFSKDSGILELMKMGPFSVG